MPPKRLWHALPGEISEKMWGTGYVTPGGKAVADLLIKPLGLTKDMNVLDLSAGLGGPMRDTAEEYGAYFTGLEPDPEVAARGMEMSRRAGKSRHAPVEHYTPQTFTVSRAYDCILAREVFYRVADKPAFFKALADCAKPKAQLAFTDYILDAEHRDKPAVKAWQAFEANAMPLGLVEMAEAWAKAGFNLRVNEDLTGFYEKEVLKGLKRLVQAVHAELKPDAETKKSLLRRIETWSHRLAAMEQGMKFCRFYGVKY